MLRQFAVEFSMVIVYGAMIKVKNGSVMNAAVVMDTNGQIAGITIGTYFIQHSSTINHYINNVITLVFDAIVL